MYPLQMCALSSRHGRRNDQVSLAGGTYGAPDSGVTVDKCLWPLVNVGILSLNLSHIEAPAYPFHRKCSALHQADNLCLPDFEREQLLAAAAAYASLDPCPLVRFSTTRRRSAGGSLRDASFASHQTRFTQMFTTPSTSVRVYFHALSLDVMFVPSEYHRSLITLAEKGLNASLTTIVLDHLATAGHCMSCGLLASSTGTTTDSTSKHTLLKMQMLKKTVFLAFISSLALGLAEVSCLGGC